MIYFRKSVGTISIAVIEEAASPAPDWQIGSLEFVTMTSLGQTPVVALLMIIILPSLSFPIISRS